MSEPSPRLAEAMDMKLATTQAERDKRESLKCETHFAFEVQSIQRAGGKYSGAASGSDHRACSSAVLSMLVDQLSDTSTHSICIRLVISSAAAETTI